MLSGGDPRSLGRTSEVIDLVGQDHQKLAELFECLFSADEIVRMRAGDAVEKICRQQPGLLSPYKQKLLEDVSKIDQPSIQWHLAQMFLELDLTKEETTRAIKIMKRNLEQSTDWIVLNTTLQALFELLPARASLKKYLLKQLPELTESRHNSVARRAKKIADKLVQLDND